MKLELTPRQYGTVAAVATALAAGVILSVALGVFLLLARFVAIFSSVFLPLRDGLHGIAGMVLAIPLTAFLVVFGQLAKAKYFTEIV